MAVEISLVKTQKDIDAVSMLAREIWTSHFTPIIGKSQVEYMLENFQSSQAIKSQISAGYEYYLAKIESQYVGYTALAHDDENHKMMISKIYTLGSVRGVGVGIALLTYIENKCVSKNVSSLWLTVNKNNHSSISWYKRRGFRIKEKIKVDIGSGFYMDDYVMEKSIQLELHKSLHRLN